MRLTLQTFFSHLIFHPFEASIKKEQKIALATSIALGILSFGICHAICALRNYVISRKSKEQETDQDKKIVKIATQNLNPLEKSIDREKQKSINITEQTVVNPIEQKRTDTAKKPERHGAWKTLGKLFDNSQYTLEELPKYPIFLEKETDVPKPGDLTHPIMIANGKDNRSYIFIKTYFNNNQENPSLLILGTPHKENVNMWCQIQTAIEGPQFFQENLTDSYGDGPTDSEIMNFKLLQCFLQNGKGEDRNGDFWQIAK